MTEDKQNRTEAAPLSFEARKERILQQQEEDRREAEAYFRAYDEWEARCGALDDLAAERAGRILEEKQRKLEEQAEADALQRREELLAGIRSLEDACRKAENEVSASGPLRFAAKMKAQEELLHLQGELEKKRAALSRTELEEELFVKAAAVQAQSGRYRLLDEIRGDLDAPDEPRMPDSLKNLMNAASPVFGSTATGKANRMYADAILSFLKSEDRAFSVVDLCEQCPELADLSNQRVSAILRQMTESGLVLREDVKRRAYFYLADNTQTASAKDASQIKKDIEAHLRRNGRALRVSELMAEIPSLSGAAPADVAAAARELAAAGVLHKQVEDGVAFYRTRREGDEA